MATPQPLTKKTSSSLTNEQLEMLQKAFSALPNDAIEVLLQHTSRVQHTIMTGEDSMKIAKENIQIFKMLTAVNKEKVTPKLK